jgi:hypothetical protein
MADVDDMAFRSVISTLQANSKLSSVGRLRQLLGILVANSDCFQHAAPDTPHGFAGYRTQLHIGLLQQLLDTVSHAVLALSQLRR